MLAVAPVSSTRYTVRERLEQARMKLSVILTLWILTTLHGETLLRPVFAWMAVASWSSGASSSCSEVSSNLGYS